MDSTPAATRASAALATPAAARCGSEVASCREVAVDRPLRGGERLVEVDLTVGVDVATVGKRPADVDADYPTHILLHRKDTSPRKRVLTPALSHWTLTHI